MFKQLTSDLSAELDPTTHQSRVMSPFQAKMVIDDHNSAIVRADPVRKSVAIIGAGKSRYSGMNLFEDPEWEVWGVNAIPNVDSEGRFRADRWFELHSIEAQTAEEMVWLRTCPVPFYMFMPATYGVMTDFEKSVFNADLERKGRDGRHFIDPRDCGLTEHMVRYPLNRAARIRPFFSCTFAYQIALAIMEGFERIALLGVDLAAGTQRERTVERACVEWWIGLAEGRGIEILRPPDLMLSWHPYFYGASYWTEADFSKQYCEALHKQEIAQ